MAPTPFTVLRSIEIAAPATSISPYLVDFHEWTVWSPWEGNDPHMERTYSGPSSGVGASYRWSGNRKAGSGTMTITEVDESRRVSIDLGFERPFKAENSVVFTLTDGPSEGVTTVEWRMSGVQTGFAKVVARIVPTDKLVGGDFEKGLRQLRAVAESFGTR